MINRIKSIAIPICLAVFGSVFFLFVDYLFEIPKIGIFPIMGLGLVIGFFEIQILRNIPERCSRWSLLDGGIFPFVSVGFAVGMIIF